MRDFYIDIDDAVCKLKEIIREEAEHWIWDETLVPYSMDSIFANKELFNILKTFKINNYDSALIAQGVILENKKLRNIIKPLIEK